MRRGGGGEGLLDLYLQLVTSTWLRESDTSADSSVGSSEFIKFYTKSKCKTATSIPTPTPMLCLVGNGYSGRSEGSMRVASGAGTSAEVKVYVA